ncbi:cell wall metabolism sensor histidine kinase WalK [Kutzneria sp. 744]|uniref:sensor histidine kinase n=1 Tax=Kutzneria sp. (strain 744) TaxID=345341 RepID=UPI0003EECE3B|nr:HAMP domain-containing sensor histidine kinase [Kutzneria sp. 744]EWM12589.1 His kinase A (phosphoacceptor) domain-containing protein [Kutzneria sp. 744]
MLARLLAVSIVVAACSIAATAWLAIQTTSVAIQQEQGQAISSGNRIYEDLVAYAARHPSWDGVRTEVSVLAQETGRRIVLTDQNRRIIVDSEPGGHPLPVSASAGVDALSVDQSFAPDRISPSAIGPYALSQDDIAFLSGLAQRALDCVRNRGAVGTITELPSGRPRIQSPDAANCAKTLNQPVKSEQAALEQLDGLVNECLSRQHLPPVAVDLDFSWQVQAAQAAPSGVAPERDDQRVQDCVTTGRHEQLTPFVAPAALLFVTSPGGSVTPSTFDLSAGNKVRIGLAAGGVLAVTILITVLAGRRFTRPLRALTAAAQRMRDGDVSASVRIRRRDEIGRLAGAFNDMAASRAQVERLRTDLISDIAHELRTPLSNIRGWLEATQDGVSEPDEALIASLLEEAVLLQHIIDDLQDLAQADAGTLRLHREPVSLTELTAQVCAAHRARADAAGIELRGDGDGEISADPVRLRQVVDNLVTNAIRHTGPGGVVRIEARRESKHAFVAVSDTGSGIAGEDLPHVFDRFWRAEKSRSRQTGGSGLGLSIVKKLVEAHGGTVGVDSVLGEGSRFWVRVPG